MESILIAGVSLMTSLKWAFLGSRLRRKQSGERDPLLALQRREGRLTQRQTVWAKAGVTAACLLLIASIASISAQAGTIAITYTYTGGLTAPPDLMARF